MERSDFNLFRNPTAPAASVNTCTVHPAARPQPPSRCHCGPHCVSRPPFSMSRCPPFCHHTFREFLKMLTVWQVLEELHCLLLQQEGRMKHEDAVQIRKQKQHGVCNIKQLLYLENITLKRVYAAKTSMVNRTE
ncbi:hypothetical protein Celaphus_00002412, partial [Cervus elaphus hippelaphus]